MIEPAEFVSVWDGGIAIRTACHYDSATCLASAIATVDVDGLESCEDQYVELTDGTQIRKRDGLKIEGQEDNED